MRPKKWFFGVFLGVAVLGLLDAAYLTAKHYQGVPPACSLLKGCEVVTTSAYATVLGVPVALGGAVYYFFSIVLLALFLEFRRRVFLQLLFLLVSGGLLATAWFVFVQIFILQAICLYCMASAASTVILFILGILSLRSAFRDHLLA